MNPVRNHLLAQEVESRIRNQESGENKKIIVFPECSRSLPRPKNYANVPLRQAQRIKPKNYANVPLRQAQRIKP